LIQELLYLTTPYYERWLTGISELLVDAGVVDREELRERTAAFAAGERELASEADGPTPGDLAEGVADAYRSERDPLDPEFAVGETVRVPKRHPSGHTRCPRYVRGVVGEVAAHRGTHVVPDENAHGREVAEPLYNVRFEAADLWGEGETDADAVRIELWERHLEGVGDDG
jgi:nitrile hydratase